MIDPHVSAAFIGGLERRRCPHLFSSTLWEAWQIGARCAELNLTPAGLIRYRGSTYETTRGRFRAFYTGKGRFEVRSV